MVDVGGGMDKHYLREDKLLDPEFGPMMRCEGGITVSHIRRAVTHLATVRDPRARIAELFLTKLRNNSYDRVSLPLEDGTINIWDGTTLLFCLKHTHKVISINLDVATKQVKVLETLARTGKPFNYGFAL